VKNTPAEAVVGFLSFASDRCARLSVIEKFTPHQWEHILQWLNDAGLAFYFLQRLKDEHASGSVPPSVLSRLERNFACNRLRIEEMARRFDAINRKLGDAGVPYTVIKGFSLVPQFCPGASLRHQADLDYLVDEQFLPAACRVLTGIGYQPQVSRSSQESIFVSSGKTPSRNEGQDSPHAPHAVELHTEIWDDDMHGVHGIPKLFSVRQARTKQWNGLPFPAQVDEDAFLLQVLHACHHIFTQWIRVSSLLEIGYFLHRRASDLELWSGIEQKAGDSAVLREFVVIVTEMAARLFAAPIPKVVQGWGREIRPEPRTWIDNYARDWALGGLPVYEFNALPRSKLALFLHHQYRSTSRAREFQPHNRSSFSRLRRIASSLRDNPALVWNADWWRRQHLFRRTVFYALAELRYVAEIPRWRWRNRTNRQGASSVPWPSESYRSKRAS
jgi:hypothetical protein